MVSHRVTGARGSDTESVYAITDVAANEYADAGIHGDIAADTDEDAGRNAGSREGMRREGWRDVLCMVATGAKMNQLQRQPTVEIMPPSQPIQNEVRHITYNVHINGAGGWLMALAQMPTAAWYGLSVAVGVIGAVVVCALLVLSAIMAKFFIVIVAVIAAVVFGVVALAAISAV